MKAAAKKIGLGAKKAGRIAKLAKKIGKKNTKKALKSWGKVKKKAGPRWGRGVRPKTAKQKAKAKLAKLELSSKKIGSAFKKLWKVSCMKVVAHATQNTSAQI